MVPGTSPRRLRRASRVIRRRAVRLLLVAHGLTLASPDALRRLLVGAAVGYSVLSFRTDYFVPYKENYRDAVEVIATQSRAGDCSVFGAPDGNSWGDVYSGRAPPWRGPPTLIDSKTPRKVPIAPGSGSCGTVTLEERPPHLPGRQCDARQRVPARRTTVIPRRRSAALRTRCTQDPLKARDGTRPRWCAGRSHSRR